MLLFLRDNHNYIVITVIIPYQFYQNRNYIVNNTMNHIIIYVRNVSRILTLIKANLTFCLRLNRRSASCPKIGPVRHWQSRNNLDSLLVFCIFQAIPINGYNNQIVRISETSSLCSLAENLLSVVFMTVVPKRIKQFFD